MGGTLGRLWGEAGHAVRLGSREPEKGGRLGASLGAGVSIGTVAEAAAFGDVIVLCTPWEATAAALEASGPLAGKIVIDVTNPLKPDGTGLAIGHTTSGGELIAKSLPEARVVKAFNSVYWENLDARRFSSPKPSLFYCGDDPAAKSVVARLGAELGFDPIDAGPLAIARFLEPMACLWMQLANSSGLGPHFTFAVARADCKS